MSETYAPGLTPEYREFQDQAAASMAASLAAAAQRQAQARTFQEAANTVNVPDVLAGSQPE